MPVKTGSSHGMAAFVSLIVGSLLSKYVWSVAPPLGEAALAVAVAIRSTTGAALPVDEQFAGTLVVMVALSFGWGVAYHVGRHS